MTLVSSHRMRSALRRTHSARSVMSPRLPIGVATRCRPGASACAGCQSAASRSAWSARRRRRAQTEAAIAAPIASGPGLLAGARWLGSPPPLASRPEAILAALASSAFRLNPCCFRAAARPRRVRRPNAYRHRLDRRKRRVPPRNCRRPCRGRSGRRRCRRRRPGRSRSASCCRCRGRTPNSARRCSKRRSSRCSRHQAKG